MKTFNVTISQNNKTFKVKVNQKSETMDFDNAAQKCYEHFNLMVEDGDIDVDFYLDGKKVYSIGFSE